MGIKLFIKENIAYLIFQVLVTFFILSIYWLDGFRNMNTAIYIFIINMLFICSFLVVRYFLRRKFIKNIVQKPRTMEDALHKNAKTVEHQVIEEYLHELYRVYQYEVQSLHTAQIRQQKFMNQWIHQMKTPVAVLELLNQADEELDKRSVQEEVDRIKNGLELVLMNARLENFEDDLQIEPVNLKQCVTSFINENKRLFITNRVFPQVDLSEDLVVMSDSKWLRFTLGQFITNAVKYTFEPNKKIYIYVEALQSSWQLIIKDEGIGIPKSDLTRVKKAFFTGENGRKTGESTGMGLYLANEICNRLGHPFQIESEVNEGTIIKITFLS